MKILYSGPIASKNKPSAGGYEAANRKNIDELRRQGVDVVELPYPTVNRRLGALGKLVYASLYLVPLKMLGYRKEKDVIFHSTPTYGTLHKPAIFIQKMARLMGFRTLTDIRAGSLMLYYNSRGTGYRRDIKRLLEGGDAITVEGSDYIGQIRDVIGVDRPVYYFPNTAACPPAPFVPRDTSTINLFYFGRITGNKGIDIMLEVTDTLDDRFHLYLAGPVAPDVDARRLNHPRVTYLGMLGADELARQMKRMHIFLLPTTHRGEGQSNSLIEAMSMGLVPVTSTQGFCTEVTAGLGINLPVTATARDYREAVLKIAGSDINAIGAQCREHIMLRHNTDTEIRRLIKIYESLCH